MSKKMIVWPAIVLFWTSCAFSYLSTWEVHRQSWQRYDSQLNEYVWVSSNYDRNVGDVSLKDVSVTVTPNGSYLDVTEDAIIGIPSFDKSSDTGSCWISGTINVPRKATITSLYFVNDSGSFSARVKPEYLRDNPIDTTLGEALATLKWSSSNVHNGNSVDRYALKIFNVAPGEEYQLVFRYMIPNSADATPTYPLNILCAGSVSNPGTVEFLFSSDTLQPPYVLSIGDMNFQLSDGQSLQIPYQPSFQLRAADSVTSRMHVTSMDSGDWKGKYLLLNTSIPDSVVARLSKQLELVVLWRWNRPNSFVRKGNYDYYYGSYSSNNKSLTGYGRQAVTQATAIRTLIDEITTTGNKAGMVHSIQYREPERFDLCGKSSSAYAKLDGYLGQFTTEYFLNSGYFEYDTEPTNPDDTLPGQTDSSRTEFLSSLKLVHGIYSNAEGILKHLVILTSGPVQISRNLITIEEIDTLLGNVSVDCDQAVWRDINFSLVDNVCEQRPLSPFAGFDLPQFRPHSFQLQVVNSDKSHSFLLSPDQASFSVIAKSQAQWSPTLVWHGFTQTGSLIDTVHSNPLMYESPQDTGLVKLWAANSKRMNDERESDIGLRYGVVSETSSLKIFPSYQGYDSTATAFAPVSNSFAYETGVDKSMKMSVKAFACFKAGNLLRIVLPGNAGMRIVRIYSLSGKLLAEFDPAAFRAANGYNIPLRTIFGSRNSQVVVVRMEGKAGSWNKKLFL